MPEYCYTKVMHVEKVTCSALKENSLSKGLARWLVRLNIVSTQEVNGFLTYFFNKARYFIKVGTK